jgi:lysophospholipase L1-like esterase
MSTRSVSRVLLFNLLFFFAGVLIIEVVFGDWFGEPTYRVNNLIRSYEADLDVSELYGRSLTIKYKRDEHGFRGPYESVGTIDILTMGGSTTDQRAIGDGETWQDLLSQSLSSTTSKFQIVNAGIDGQSSYGHVRNFDWWLANIEGLRARFVMVYVGVNDFYLPPPPSDLDELRPPKSLGQRSILFSLGSKLLGTMAVYDDYHLLGHRRVDLAKRKWTQKAMIEDHEVLMRPRLEAYRVRIDELVNRIHGFGAIPVFVTQYFRAYKFVDGSLWGHSEEHKYMGRTINGVDVFKLMSKLNDVTLAVCRKADAICIDLGGDAARGTLKLDDEDFYDFVHPSPSGTRKIAEYLSARLRDVVL